MHPVALRALERLFAGSDPLVIAIQNVAEFWNAATRPLAVNGLGMTIDQVRGEVKRLEGIANAPIRKRQDHFILDRIGAMSAGITIPGF